jgi:hypothetical protein
LYKIQTIKKEAICSQNSEAYCFAPHDAGNVQLIALDAPISRAHVRESRIVDRAKRLVGLLDVYGNEAANAEVAKIAEQTFWRLNVSVVEQLA